MSGGDVQAPLLQEFAAYSIGIPPIAGGMPFGAEQPPPVDGTDHWVGRKIPALIDACDLPHEDRFIVYLPQTVKDEGEGRGDLGRDTNGC